jgi:hypothetical protein
VLFDPRDRIDPAICAQSQPRRLRQLLELIAGTLRKYSSAFSLTDYWGFGEGIRLFV